MKRKALIITGCILIVLLLAWVTLRGRFLTDDWGADGQLGQIIAVETSLLKAWQQEGALKSILNPGSSSDEVKMLQRMLSQDPEAYPERMVTGYYGTLTVEAVKRFQREEELRPTGVVDATTRDTLNKIFLSHLCPSPDGEVSDLMYYQVRRTKPLPSGYVPDDLIEISQKVRSYGIACARKDIVDDLLAMVSGARADGVELMVTSGYRKPEIQKHLYDLWFQLEGVKAVNEVAYPGFSEHQLGTAFDFTDTSIGNALVSRQFGTSKGGRWMQENAHRFGFSMSFPKNKLVETGFEYEPWHWRYVGVENATKLKEMGKAYNELVFDSAGEEARAVTTVDERR